MAERWPDVVWLNGPFGVGKTTVAEALVTRIDAAVVVDPELIGLVLRSALPEPELVDDFQALAQWRRLTVETVRGTARGSCVIVPMTVVDQGVFDETVGSLRREGVDLAHVTLMAPAEVIRERLRNRDGETNAWAKARVEMGVEALGDERFSVHVNAAERSSEELADAILEMVMSR